jgi:aminotransferase EvaB
VQINDISANLNFVCQELEKVVSRVITKGWFVLGPEVKNFEAAFSRYIDTKNCISVANGTDALELAVRAVGATQGERVATVANAGMYSALAMMAAGAEPLFIDVDEQTQVTTLTEVKRAVAAGVRAVIVTHLYGCRRLSRLRISASTQVWR